MLTEIIWPVVVVFLWAALFGITVLLVRYTMHGQQEAVREEIEAEQLAVQAAQSSAPLSAPAARRAPQPPALPA